ncbi:MAG: hypothetical protein SGI92_19735 [Bryobacteraceae bacterium]|nr:hypothetical protein [Bryobacteraceae bacterium]
MNKQGLTVGLIAVVAVVAAVGAILFSTRHNKVEVKGQVLKVRSHQLSADRTVVLMDVRLENPSTQQFMVKDVEVYVDGSDGKPTQADIFSDVDGQRVIDYYPVLGKKYNPSLIRRDKIASGKTVDRTLLINVPISDVQFAARKGLRIVVQDADGPKSEFSEAR